MKKKLLFSPHDITFTVIRFSEGNRELVEDLERVMLLFSVHSCNQTCHISKSVLTENCFVRNFSSENRARL